MIKNYFKLALRNTARRKLYSIINITGLAVASAFCILVYWYVKNEQSFDQFHENKDQLYRVEFNNFSATEEKPAKAFFSFLRQNPEQQNSITTPPVLAVELQKALPEIEHAVRISRRYEEIVRVNNESFKEKNNSAYVDEDFFKAFSFPLTEGSASEVLAEKNNIVLSEKMALKYFGTTNAVGKTLILLTEDTTAFTVSGIAKNFPSNSSFQFDLIMPRTSTVHYQEEIDEGLNTSKDLLILQLKKGTDVRSFNRKLNDFCKKYYASTLKEWAAFPGSDVKPDNFHVFLRPFPEAHFNSSQGWGHYTNLKNIYQLILLAIVILLIACLNYILLTLTGTVSRSQEVGIRKTVGAERKQIILQFYIETQFVAFIAVMIGFLISIICLPLFSNLVGSDLQLQFFSLKEVTVFILALALLLGFSAGIYPALVMSGLKPMNMLRNFSAYRLNPYLSRILVITQYSVCIILIISTLVIRKQMIFINQKDLGFDKDNIITIENPYLSDNDLKRSYMLRERLAHFASAEPSIKDFTSSFLGYNNTNTHLINGERTMLEALDVDYNYFSFFRIPIVKGRGFSPSVPEDSATIKLTEAQQMEGASAARSAIVVNQTLYNLLGQPPLYEINRAMGGRIIGVCKDYYPDDLTRKIAPAYHRIQKHYLSRFSIKISAGQNIPEVIEKIRTNWNKITDKEPLSFTFLDETLEKNYSAYLQWMKTVTLSGILAIVIACMGLFGLSGLTTVNRIKEIGIRKVLGASVIDLFFLLNKSTFLMTIISFVVALPVAGYLSNEWLQNFAYRIHPEWWLFALGGIISVLTAFIAVSYHTIKTATANPVKSLRTE